MAVKSKVESSSVATPLSVLTPNDSGRKPSYQSHLVEVANNVSIEESKNVTQDREPTIEQDDGEER